MANIKNVYGAQSALTITLASLANGSAQQSTVVVNSNNVLDYLILVKIRTGASGIQAYGTVNIYGYGSLDGGTTYTEEASGSNSTITLRAPTNAKLITTITANVANTTFVGGPFSVAKAFGGVIPPRWGIALQNRSGGAFSSTEGDHSVQIMPVHLEVA